MRGAAASALEVDRVSAGLRGRPVLQRLSMSVAQGECHAIVGLNGAGKTTALRVIPGMLRPDAGRVLLHGRDISSAPRDVWRRVGHLVETPFSYPELTTRQNITASARLHGADPERAERTAERMSEALVTGHHFDELTRIADRVEVLPRGRIVDTITPGEPGRPGGADLERVFFDAILAADQAAQDPGSGRSSRGRRPQEERRAS